MPSLIIDEVAAESGQRVVYFAHFDDSLIPVDIPPPDEEPDKAGFLYGWGGWGQIVVKVVSGAGADTLARLQAETAILEEVRPADFPKLLYSNLFTENPVTEVRLAEGLYVTVEEFIESKPLNEVLDRYRGNEPAIVELAIGVANAIFPLWEHPKRFVHRDIKPANILIRPSGEVVVIDLGIARETGVEGLTQEGWGRAPVTVGYAAPEQIANDKAAISFKSDFFALGVLMYYLLSGAKPFHLRTRMDMAEVAEATESFDPPVLKDFCGASMAFSAFVEKAMMKKPWQRHRTPEIFITELNAMRSV
ncbi:protein kinase [Acidovorax sp. SUPP2539]|uniref:serine/threonine protein kinase n=1 Tax=Acidovorax sp. SUPP2539 TaxID=2920878 RepID=UPI0023DE4BC5|nr:protein kinase [Acidovorax sp. SUPP2539]GKS89671.1 protein kinase [Acidovorax sp. SUPP2539]